MEFKVNDKVRIKKDYRQACGPFGNEPVLTVTGVTPGKNGDPTTVLITVKDSREFTDSYYAFRFEHVSVRVEGEEIAAKDIRVGDEIRAEWTADDLTLTRQAVVGALKQGTIPYLLSADGRRIDPYIDKTTYRLIKAAPEPDRVLLSLKADAIGTVGELPNGKKTLFRKEDRFSGPVYVTFYPGGQVSQTEEEFADTVRDYFDDIRWLS